MKKYFVALLCFVFQLNALVEWSFPPEAISAPGQSISEPAIAVDSNGNAVAIWIHNGVVKSRFKLAEMSWSSPETTLSGMGSSDPSIVIDDEGNSTAIWLENGIVKVASKTLNGVWSNSIAISNAKASQPCIAIDSTGNVTAAWVRNGDIQTSVKMFAGNWQNAVNINAAGSSNPHVSMGGSGANARALVVWQGVSNQMNVVYASSKLLSKAGWGGKEIISQQKHQAGYPKGSIDSDGNMIATWFAFDQIGDQFSRVLVQSASSGSDEKWSGVKTVSKEGNGDPSKLSLTIGHDGLGNALALWSTVFDGQNYSIQSARKLKFEGWSKPENLVDSNQFSFGTNLTLSSSGDAFALYMFYNGLNLLVQSSEKDTTGFVNAEEAVWQLPNTISIADYNSFPSIAAKIKNGVIQTAGIWIGSLGLSNSAFATTGSKLIPLSPENLTVEQFSTDYGVFLEYYNTISWDPSPDENVVGYLIFRNGQYVGRVGADEFEFIDYNRVQNGPVVYGIAAVNAANDHSMIQTVSFP